ncbi:MAG: D-alanine--D-alanine ligase [Alistipes sp.]|jgi:D-alanine-D-alanine ligase|nr:D-alanine--D-alanine ligase [Alistipes sp.]
MKTTIGVFFGGRSVEHEISVISALQAIAALDAARYDVVPVYITKSGRWLTGPALLDTAAYRDMTALEKRATEVYMKPAFGSHALLRRGGLKERTVATLDVALPVLHGTNGEDGTFQGFLELIGIPYAGCGVLASAVGMDKITAKMMLRESGLPVIDYVWFTDRQWSRERDALIARIEGELTYPVIVKPANLGSSVGISRARDREELIRAVGEATGYSSRMIVERMIEPLREINCSVLGSPDNHRTSVCEEPVHSDEILSYADKYMSGGAKGGAKGSAKGGAKGNSPRAAAKTAPSGAKTVSGGMSSTKRRIPADLPEALSTEIRHLASETFRTLGCDGIARVDFILDGGHSGTENSPKVYVNEINTIPGSLSFYLWEATGLDFGDLMDTLISGALKRTRDKSNKTLTYSANIFSY